MPRISEASNVGPYQLLHPLPELRTGNHVEAWLSELPDREEQIVLNVLRIPHRDLDEEHQRVYQAFRNEVDVLKRSRHLNIVRIYPLLSKALSLPGESYLSKVDADGESWWFWAMEHLHGGSLASRMKQIGRLSVQEAAEIAYQVAAALDYLHAKGFVHLSVQPRNVFFREPLSGPKSSMELVLTDFREATSADQAVGGGRVAEVAYKSYLAPERIRPPKVSSEEPIDNRPMDVYSVGVLFYHMLAGTPPFSGNGEDVERAILASKPNPLQRFDVPDEVKELIFQALRRDPAERPSMEQLMIALDKSVPPPREVGVYVTVQKAAPAEGAPSGAEAVSPRAPTVLERFRALFRRKPPAPKLLAPADGAALKGEVNFKWDWSGELKDNMAFELRMWKEGQVHDSVGELQVEPELEVDLDALVPELPGEGNECFWSVAVVRESPYGSLSEEAGPRTFTYGEQPLERKAEERTPAARSAERGRVGETVDVKVSGEA